MFYAGGDGGALGKSPRSQLQHPPANWSQKVAPNYRPLLTTTRILLVPRRIRKEEEDPKSSLRQKYPEISFWNQRKCVLRIRIKVQVFVVAVSKIESVSIVFTEMKGVLEKKASDGIWKKHEFTLQKHMLSYTAWQNEAPSDGPSKPRAILNLLDLDRIELKAGRLNLYTEDNAHTKRKHNLREVKEAASDGRSFGPSLADWEAVFHEELISAKQTLAKQNVAKQAADAEAQLSNLQRLSENDEEDATSGSREGSSELSVEANPRDQITAFYEKHNPDKIDGVDALIIKYHDLGVTPAELHIAIQQKYALRLISTNTSTAEDRQCAF